MEICKNKTYNKSYASNKNTRHDEQSKLINDNAYFPFLYRRKSGHFLRIVMELQ